MYQCSEAMKKTINGLSPRYHSYLIFDDFTITDDELYSIEAEHGSVTEKDLLPGSVVSQTITIEAILTNNKISGREFSWEISGVDNTGQETDERIPMGRFIVNSCVKMKNHYKIEASDKLSKSDVLYAPKIPFPAWTDDITEDICSQLCLEYNKQAGEYFLTKSKGYYHTINGEKIFVDSFNYLIEKPVANATMREILGFIAGMQGKFGIVDRDGMFCYKGFEEVSEDIFTDKIDEPELNEEEVGIYEVRCKVIKDGKNAFIEHPNVSGVMTNIVTWYNPYMTELLIKQVLRNWTWRYMPCKIPLRIADPRIDVWDIYSYEGFKIPVMQIERKDNGGFSSTIQATVSDKEEVYG